MVLGAAKSRSNKKIYLTWWALLSSLFVYRFEIISGLQ